MSHHFNLRTYFCTMKNAFLLVLISLLPVVVNADCRGRYFEQALQESKIVVYGRLFVQKNKRLQGQTEDTYSGAMIVYETLKGEKKKQIIVLNLYSVDYFYKPKSPSLESKTGVFCLFFDKNKQLSFAEAGRCSPPNFVPVVNGSVNYRARRDYQNKSETIASFKKTMKKFL